MKIKPINQQVSCLLAISTLTLSFATQAALVGRDLDGNLATAEAYYDTDGDLTWLADASLGIGTSMGLNTAKVWAANLDVAGVTGWRLPDADPTCGYDYNCISSEMGNLFYNVLGNTAGSLTNTGPFTGVRLGYYWSATSYNGFGGWAFSMGEGRQGAFGGNYSLYAWAVQSGDVGASVVPVPATAWLFGSALLGLVGLKRKAKLNS